MSRFVGGGWGVEVVEVPHAWNPGPLDLVLRNTDYSPPWLKN